MKIVQLAKTLLVNDDIPRVANELTFGSPIRASPRHFNYHPLGQQRIDLLVGIAIKERETKAGDPIHNKPCCFGRHKGQGWKIRKGHVPRSNYEWFVKLPD